MLISLHSNDFLDDPNELTDILYLVREKTTLKVDAQSTSKENKKSIFTPNPDKEGTMNIWYSSWEMGIQFFLAFWGLSTTPREHAAACRQWHHFNLLAGDQHRRFIAML